MKLIEDNTVNSQTFPSAIVVGAHTTISLITCTVRNLSWISGAAMLTRQYSEDTTNK